MNNLDLIQHSPEWYAARIGMATASKIKEATAKRKRGDGELACRRNLKLQMLSEILSGRTTDHYVSAAMDWGIENEPRARAEYEIKTGYSVEPLGLVLHPTLERAAASPDGYIPQDGLLEIKCPETWTHIEYLTEGVVPPDYIPQMMWQMACAGPEIKWCDFVSYDPRLKDELQLFVIRLDRDDKKIAEMEDAVIEFLSELNEMASRLQSNLKHKTVEAKLRESIRQVGKYPDFEAELQITEQDIA